MIPFENYYYRNKLQEFNEKCRIKKDISYNSIKFEHEYQYEYKNHIYKCMKLMINNKLAMIVSPVEIYQCYEAAKEAKGNVCIVGLGLGYFVQEIIDKDEVKKITVFEIDKNVIELYKMNFKQNEKIEIYNEDIFKYIEKMDRSKFDFLFCDIYTYRITKKNIEDYKLLTQKLEIRQYTFFGVERLILSIKKYNLDMNKVPEFWKTLGEDMERRLSKSDDNIKYIGYSEVIEILKCI